ncbi:MAG: hypothetical protein A3F09_05765 [Chlamydiae bacterium RIFCSPHIGHO2_12_FULL_49_11]|nr:MAG: hypothetical protein A3F09_05765 [Chlamydiae bacterium RIFCSPHIGHO2_12_FULL_49_11]
MTCDLSIITVTYQSEDYIQNCLVSVMKHIKDLSYEHIVIDNDSTDATVPKVEALAFLPHIKLIQTGRNIGFARANQIGFDASKGRVILFLNPDMEMKQGFLDDLVQTLDSDPHIGILSCKLMLLDGSYTYPVKTTGKLIYFISLFHWFAKSKTLLKKSSYIEFDIECEQEVGHVKGAFMMMPRFLLSEIGHAFDPRYVLLQEDVDLSREVTGRGYKIIHSPKTTCIDFNNRSMSRCPSMMPCLCNIRGILTYVNKWFAPTHLLWSAMGAGLYFLRILWRAGFKASWQGYKLYRHLVKNCKEYDREKSAKLQKQSGIY